MSARVELRLVGTLDHLRVVWQTGDALLEAVPFAEDPSGTRYNFMIAVQEMLTNVLRHAYGGDESIPVEVAFEIDDQRAAVEIRDQGPEFDPRQVDRPEEDAFPMEEGGYGIMITKTVMDELDYQRVDGWNVLSMSKSVVPVEMGVENRL